MSIGMWQIVLILVIFVLPIMAIVVFAGKRTKRSIRHTDEFRSTAGYVRSHWQGEQSLAVEEHGAIFASLPPDVLKRWFEISEDVVAETGAGSYIDKRIYESWSTFRKQAVEIAPLSTLGYMQSRNSWTSP